MIDWFLSTIGVVYTVSVMDLVLVAMGTPLATGLLVLVVRHPAVVSCLSLFAATVISGTLFEIIAKIVAHGAFSDGFILIDPLNSVFLAVIAVLIFTSALFSFSYIETEWLHKRITLKMVPRYYALFHFFILSMISTLVVANLGLIWVSVEATTLSSALLVAFYFHRSALEAAWKYVMVCAVGIAMAMLGVILLYYAQASAGSPDIQALSWLELRTLAPTLDKSLLRLSLAFLIVGFGTKAGLAPMHTWLPDAHSQAPSPISGLLSGALLSCAMYAIARNLAVFTLVPGLSGFAETLLVGLGFFSILVAVPFLMIQNDLKRLFAYSSVENMGVVALGLGIGSPLAIYAALFHIVNHAIAKSTLFYLAGILIHQFHTKQIMRIRGLLKNAPLLGVLLVFAVLAIVGTPPFGVFYSKFSVIQSIFDHQRPILGLVVLLILAGGFAGMVYYLAGMSFGSRSGGQSEEPVSVFALAAVIISIALMLIGGVYMPPWLDSFLKQAAAIVSGGTSL